MKKLVYSIALFGLVVLTACSGDSPGAKPVPTVVPQAWGISSFQVDNPYPYLEQVVYLAIEATQNGLPAPDGTAVEFTANVACVNPQDPNGEDGMCAGFSGDLGRSTVSVQIDDGQASATFVSVDAGVRAVRARVHDVTAWVNIAYQVDSGPPTEDLVIYTPLIPNIGSFDGEEMVMLRGTGIRSPAEVAFFVQGRLYPAQVTEVIESVPLSGPGQITVITPEPTLADRNQSGLADVTVQRGVGTPLQQLVNLPAAFTFLNVIEGGPPVVYSLDPNYGRSGGGDGVDFHGRNFVVGETTVRWFGTVLGSNGGTFDVTTPPDGVSVSPNGQLMQVITPRFWPVDVMVDSWASVEVTTPNGQYTFTGAFVIMADDPSPVINSLSPIAGPLGGGTLVTIYGTGFQFPARVDFGDLTATDVNVTNDPTPGGIDVITCVSPDYSQQGGVPPVTVGVTVTNLESNNPNRISNAVNFTYGDNLFISGNSPTNGRPGDQVVIYGAGFEDPLQVFFGPDELDVQSVSGTEILVRFPTDLPVSCSDRTGTFRVRLIESNQEATGGSYELLGNTPNVVAVDPVFVQSVGGGTGVFPNEVTITGTNFAENLLVKINDFVVSPSGVTVVNSETIEVVGIPSPLDFDLEFDISACTTPGGDPGVRQTPSPVSVTVVNFPGDCSNTLQGGLIYEPEDTSCVPVPVLVLSTTEIDFGDFVQANEQHTQSLTVTNDGGVAMDWTWSSSSVFFWISATPTVGPNSSETVDVIFNSNTVGAYDETITITATDPFAIGSPQVVRVLADVTAPP